MNRLVLIGFALGYVGASRLGRRGLNWTPREMATNAAANLRSRLAPAVSKGMVESYLSWLDTLPVKQGGK